VAPAIVDEVNLFPWFLVLLTCDGKEALAEDQMLVKGFEQSVGRSLVEQSNTGQ
jgi:hypothetical protein